MTDAHGFDRRISDANVASLSVRVTGLEARVTNLEKEIGDNTLELRANTVLTQQVHKNTEDIVELIQWMGTLKRGTVSVARYVTIIGGAFAAVFASLKGAADIDVIDHLKSWWTK